MQFIKNFILTIINLRKFISNLIHAWLIIKTRCFWKLFPKIQWSDVLCYNLFPLYFILCLLHFPYNLLINSNYYFYLFQFMSTTVTYMLVLIQFDKGNSSTCCTIFNNTNNISNEWAFLYNTIYLEDIMYLLLLFYYYYPLGELSIFFSETAEDG